MGLPVRVCDEETCGLSVLVVVTMTGGLAVESKVERLE